VSVVIPNPVDTNAFSYVGNERRGAFRGIYGLTSNDIVIGRIGQSYNGKWSVFLIDIFEELRLSYPQLKLLVVNPPDNITSRIENSNDKSDIILIDSIYGDENLSDCYSAIDIFVLIAEQGESFGMVLAEALLCETPVVTLSTPWGDNSQGEVVGNGIGGLVAANKKNVMPLVKKLIDEPFLRKKLGDAGRQRVISLYDYKKVSEKSLGVASGKYYENQYYRPVDLMIDTYGQINLLTRWILESNKFYSVLKYSTGYMPWSVLRRKILKRMWSMAIRLFTFS
jgi:glycosyltransferase involved in cell wall biosynthesis